MSYESTMLHLDSIISATVSAVEVYGAYLRSDGDQILVFVYEVDWTRRISDCREAISVGDMLAVKILRYVPETQLYIGSIRQARPAEEPLLWLRNQAIGSRHQGIVTHHLHGQDGTVNGIIVSIHPGVSGMLVVKDYIPAVDAPIDVKIAKIESSGERLLEFEGTWR